MLRRTIAALGLLVLLIFFGSPLRLAFSQEPAKNHSAPIEKSEGEKTQAGGTHEPNIMELQAPLAIWTLVVFIALMAVLGKYAWKPLMKALAEREAHLEQILVDSEKARNDAEALAAQHRKELASAADQVRALIEDARKEARVAANSIIEKAQAEAEVARQRAERDIATAKDQALMEIWSSTANLAVSVAGKVLSKELGESDHRRLVEVAMAELPANGNGARGART